MQYQKITFGITTIEFHNNWVGEETVVVNGQVVSRKSTKDGAQHYFSVMEFGHNAHYVLISRIGSNGLTLDLIRNGRPVRESVPLQYGFNDREFTYHPDKLRGLKKLKEYDLEGALEEFEKAVGGCPEDPEIYFHMACAYSVLEDLENGYECLRKAVELGLRDLEMILNHDMLAFLRIHEALEAFLDSGFKQYQLEKQAEEEPK